MLPKDGGFLAVRGTDHATENNSELINLLIISSRYSIYCNMTVTI